MTSTYLCSNLRPSAETVRGPPDSRSASKTALKIGCDARTLKNATEIGAWSCGCRSSMSRSPFAGADADARCFGMCSRRRFSIFLPLSRSLVWSRAARSHQSPRPRRRSFPSQTPCASSGVRTPFPHIIQYLAPYIRHRSPPAKRFVNNLVSCAAPPGRQAACRAAESPPKVAYTLERPTHPSSSPTTQEIQSTNASVRANDCRCTSGEQPDSRCCERPNRRRGPKALHAQHHRRSEAAAAGRNPLPAQAMKKALYVLLLCAVSCAVCGRNERDRNRTLADLISNQR